jgi:hypothetical protein
MKAKLVLVCNEDYVAFAFIMRVFPLYLNPQIYFYQSGFSAIVTG